MAIGQTTEAEIQAMITNVVDILEKIRVQADVWAAPEGPFDVLIKSLEGNFAPETATAVASLRSQVSDLLTAGVAQSLLLPLIREYMQFISEDGTVTTANTAGAPEEMMSALFQHMINNALTVESRAITYDTTTTKTTTTEGGTSFGTGDIKRLTVDEHGIGYDLESCTIERKNFVCVRDQNTGVKEEAEVFEVRGEVVSFDQMGRNTAGVSGQLGSGFLGTIGALNAGNGNSGSLLRNSSFSDFNSANTNRFDGWAPTYGASAVAADVTQDTTNTYRQFPGSSTSASMKIAMDSSGDSIIHTQVIADMSVSQLDPNVPYFLRIMWNGTVGSAVGGTIKLRLGSTEVTVSVAQSNWQELLIPADKDTWTRNFNQDDFGIDIEWDAGTSGFLLIDDVLFAPYTLIGGTYWAIRQVHATAPLPWLLDDLLHVTDTGGAPATGEIQYWLYRSGLGYLPGAATNSWSDPS